MTIREVKKYIEDFTPISYQESYDNCGLIVGNQDLEVEGILITLDITESVLEEAIEKRCNLIISHHPVLFQGIKKITSGTQLGKILIKAIQCNISLYAAHTNLDNVRGGVSFQLAKILGLQDGQILLKKEDTLAKLVTFAPHSDAKNILEKLHEVGAGSIGNYSHCSFVSEGTGSFLPNENAHPTLGERHSLETVQEQKIEVIFPRYLQNIILLTLKKHHPYEEIAYDIIHLTNENQEVGSGVIGYLEQEMGEEDFLFHLKKVLNLSVIKYTPFHKKIRKVAVCGGSGYFLLPKAILCEADAFVTSDFKYHQYFENESKILIADIGHYESEICMTEILHNYLLKKNMNNIYVSQIITNPIKYYY